MSETRTVETRLAKFIHDALQECGGNPDMAGYPHDIFDTPSCEIRDSRR